MCRNIKTLFNFDPPVTPEEVRAASLQFVRTSPHLFAAAAFPGNNCAASQPGGPSCQSPGPRRSEIWNGEVM